MLDNKATGHTKNFNAEIASVAKDLKAGQKLDGEGVIVLGKVDFIQKI